MTNQTTHADYEYEDNYKLPETPPAPNGTGEKVQVLETAPISDTTLAEIERDQRELIERLKSEKVALAIKIKSQEEQIEHMRDTYWTLSRRLKLFANDFCLDEGYAGAVRFIINESNSDWVVRSPEPSDSEIPF